MRARLFAPLALVTLTTGAACSSSGQTPVDTTGCGTPSSVVADGGASDASAEALGNATGSGCVPSGGSTQPGGSGAGSGGGTATGASDAGGAVSGGGVDATVPIPPVPHDGG